VRIASTGRKWSSQAGTSTAAPGAAHAPRGGLEVVALFMDGMMVAEQTAIVVLGITRDGHAGDKT